MLKAIIFDLDGVLVDATEWHFDALNEALSIFGFEISTEDHLRIYNGLPTAEKLRLLSQRQGLPQALHSVIHVIKRKLTDQRVTQMCRPSHEKQIMLSTLKKAGYKIACCSNAQRYSVINMLKLSQIDHYFDEIIGNDEGFAPKPSPEIYLEAFKRLKVKPHEVIIIEDAPHGILAAKESGAKVIPVKGYSDVNISLFLSSGVIR
jgi:beta-phosphoglucomutase